MSKKKFRRRPNIKSGGIRVEEYGLIQLLCDATVIWGIHNERCSTTEMKKGQVFNSLNMVGSWHDVVPIYEKTDKIFFKRIGDEIPYTEVEKLNKLVK